MVSVTLWNLLRPAMSAVLTGNNYLVNKMDRYNKYQTIPWPWPCRLHFLCIWSWPWPCVSGPLTGGLWVGLRLPLGMFSLTVIVNLALNSHEAVKPKWIDKFVNIKESIASLVFYIHFNLLCKRRKHYSRLNSLINPHMLKGGVKLRPRPFFLLPFLNH